MSYPKNQMYVPGNGGTPFPGTYMAPPNWTMYRGSAAGATVRGPAYWRESPALEVYC